METAYEEQIDLRAQTTSSPNTSQPTVQIAQPTTPPPQQQTLTQQTVQQPTMSLKDQQAENTYKSLWKSANEINDKTGMEYAHTMAENIRAKYGFSGGDDGSQYVELGQPAQQTDPLQERYDSLLKELDERAEAQKLQQKAALDANYANTIQQINNNYALSVEEQERMKQKVEQQYTDGVKQIEDDTYKQMEMNKVMAEQRGLASSNQALAASQGTLSRSTKMKIEQANTRSQALNDIAQRIATLTTQKNNDLTSARSQYDAGILGANANIDAQTSQNKFDMNMSSYEYERNTAREDEVLQDQRVHQDVQNNIQRQFEIRMQEDKQEFDKELQTIQNEFTTSEREAAQNFKIEFLDKESQKELERMAVAQGYDLSKMSAEQTYALARMAKQNGYDVNLAELGFRHDKDMFDKKTEHDLNMLSKSFENDKAILELEKEWEDERIKAENSGMDKDFINWIDDYNADIGTTLGNADLTQEQRQEKVKSTLEIMKQHPYYLQASPEEKAFLDNWAKQFVQEKVSFAESYYTTAKDTGSLLNKYEGGVSTINPGTWDVKGGKSYGAFQFAGRQRADGSWYGNFNINNNEMAGFINWLSKNDNAVVAGAGNRLNSAKIANKGYIGGFDNVYKQVVNKLGESKMYKLQQEYAMKTYLTGKDGIIPKLKSQGYRVPQTKTVNEVLFSTAIQHGVGGANTIVKRTLEKTIPLTETGFIKNLYSERIKYTSKEKEAKMLKSRYEAEREDALAMARGGK